MEMLQCLERLPLTARNSVACLVSGGIDSMVLLDLARRLQNKIPFRLAVVHFNYHLRGAESERDADFVRRSAQDLNVPVHILDEPIAKGPGIQERVRKLRLQRMEILAQELRLTHALMAHHADDQAETVLMRLIRGAGIRGLAGMDRMVPLPGGLKILRPLLDYSRRDIARYAQEQGIPFVEDASNATRAYFRNRIRHDVLPQLEREIPEFLGLIREASGQLREEYERYREEARSWLQASSNHPEGIPLEAYLQLSQPVRFLVTESFLKQNGFSKEVTSRLFDEIEGLLRKGKPLERTYGPAAFSIGYGNFWWERAQAISSQPENFNLELKGPGRYWIEPLQKELILEYRASESFPSNGQKHFLDFRSFTFPLYLRFAKPGDRFIPFGMTHTKKLQDYFTDRKIPRHLRKKALLLWERERLLCVIGHQISEYCRMGVEDPSCLAVYWG